MKMRKMKDCTGDVDWESVDQAAVFSQIMTIEACLSLILTRVPEATACARVIQTQVDNLKYALGVKPEGIGGSGDK